MSWTQQNVRLQSSINSVGIHCCMEILPMLMSSLTGEMVDLLFTALSSFSLSSPTSSGMWGMATSLPRACCKFRLQKDSLTTTHIVLSIQRTDFLPTIKIMFQGIPGLPKQYLNNWNVFFLTLYCKSLILFELPRYKYFLTSLCQSLHTDSTKILSLCIDALAIPVTTPAYLVQCGDFVGFPL